MPFKNYILDFLCFERKLVVEVDGGPSAVGAVQVRLTELGVAVSVEDGRLVVVLASDEVFDRVRDALADTGVPVRRLQRRTRSLEEVYLGAST